MLLRKKENVKKQRRYLLKTEMKEIDRLKKVIEKIVDWICVIWYIIYQNKLNSFSRGTPEEHWLELRSKKYKMLSEYIRLVIRNSLETRLNS